MFNVPKKTQEGRKSAAKASASKKGPPTVTGEIVRLGKDEMNLVEHPFGVLWQKEPDDSVIYYEWDQEHPVTGKIVRATWTVTGDSDYGLPSPSDERVYLVLMELTREARFNERTIHFSRYDLIKRLSWVNNDQCYAMLEAAFKRLTGVMIYAKNAFWNPKTKNYINTGFHVLESFGLEAEQPGRKSEASDKPVSFFTWNEVLFTSFENGYIRSLDLEFALSLQGDIALRLYRYLDKKSYGGRAWFEIDIFKLCIGHLGMKPSLYPSKFKERLQGAHEELIGRGFLKAVEYEKTRLSERKSEKVRYFFAERAEKSLDATSDETSQLETGEETPPFQGTLLFDGPGQDAGIPLVIIAPESAAEIEPQNESEVAEAFTEPQRELLARMEKIRVSPQIARELLAGFPASAIAHQLDCLADRKPRSKAATFVKSVRELWALPDEYVARLEAQERAESRRVEQDQQEAEKARLRALERQETAHLDEENSYLDAMWEKLDARTRERIDAETLGKLGVLGSLGRGEAARIAFRRTALRELLSLVTPVENPESDGEFLEASL